MSDGIRAQQIPKTTTVVEAAPGHSTIGHIVRLLGRFVSGQRRLFILALVLLIIEAVTAVFEAYPLSYLIDYLNAARPDLPAFLGLPTIVSPMIDTIALLTGAIIIMAMINSLADSLAEIYLAKGGRMLGYNLRVTLYAHLQRLSLAFHDKRRTGDILTRVTSDVAGVEDFVIGSLSDIASSLLVLAGTLAFLFYQSWQVGLVAVVIVPVLALISNHFSQRIKAASRQQRAREGDLASSAQEMLTSIRVVQTYSRANYEQQRSAEHSHKAMNAALEAAGHQARFSWVIKVLEALAISVVVWIGIWLINRGTLSVGMLILCIILIQNMFKPTRKIIKEWNTIGKIYASVERIGELLDRQPVVQDLPDAVAAPPLKGYVEFKHVSFAYQSDPEDGVKSDKAQAQPRMALHDINFSIAPGEVMALVGHTGAGKSTIAQLLPRLYDPHIGHISIDGHDIREFTLESLRSQISMVLQETLLFSGSVAENIAYGRTEATLEEIIAAAKQANAHEFIENLSEGYDTLLGERGANLSGGQRQRIAIARAFIRNTPILILDEPTTGLDAASTELVLTALRTLMKGKTTIIISHDFNLIRHADKIVVLKEGAINEIGTHQELLAAKGVYADLYFKQFGLAEVEQNTSTPEDQPESFEALLAEALPEPAPQQDVKLMAESAHAPAAIQSVEHGKTKALEPAYLNPLHSPVLQDELPGLLTAFDADAMREYLQVALFGADRASYTIERCTPGKATYLNGEGCLLRYELEVSDNTNGRTLSPLVLAGVFPDRQACEQYLDERLAPLVAQMHGREEIAPFATPVAMLNALNMVVHVFPIDGELPMLVAATDRRRMIEIFRETLPATLTDGYVLQDCQVELGHYGRQHRCVLRYLIEARHPDTNKTKHWIIYGKLAADDRGALTGPVLSALRGRMLRRDTAYQFNVPKSLGFRADLRLALMEAIPGVPMINQLLKKRLNRTVDGEVEGTLTLEQALDTSARMLATLHTSDIMQGRPRTFNDELAALYPQVNAIQQISPELGQQLESWLKQIESYAGKSDPSPLCFSHGDFTYTQVIFDGTASGLVDFDTICEAEPALDLGQFLAYLRVAMVKAQQSQSPPFTMFAQQLCAQFLHSYIAATGANAEQEAQLRSRVAAYEVVSLLRMAVHSWQKLKGTRLEHVLTVLRERLSVLPQVNEQLDVDPQLLRKDTAPQLRTIDKRQRRRALFGDFGAIISASLGSRLRRWQKPNRQFGRLKNGVVTRFTIITAILGTLVGVLAGISIWQLRSSATSISSGRANVVTPTSTHGAMSNTVRTPEIAAVSQGATITSTTVPAPARTDTSTSTPANVPSAALVIERVAAVEAALRTGRFDATIHYENGIRSLVQMRFDLGDEGSESRIHITSSYEGTDGSQDNERITIGNQSWLHQSNGSWTSVPAQPNVQGELQLFLPDSTAASNPTIHTAPNGTELRWYDGVRNADISLFVDPDSGIPQELRRSARSTGVSITVVYHDWNQAVEIEPPEGISSTASR